INGTLSCSLVNNFMVSKTYGTSSSGLSVSSLSISFLLEIGLSITGPIPDFISTSTPIAGKGLIISLYKIAASFPSFSTGKRVTYAHISGSCVISNSVCFFRISKYSFRSEEHTSELQSRFDLVCRLLLEKKNKYRKRTADRKNRR